MAGYMAKNGSKGLSKDKVGHIMIDGMPKHLDKGSGNCSMCGKAMPKEKSDKK